jgi:exopolyphosphatase/guanosine-5'-triphosphate,3'-diphosphate pyrophosphatase
MKSERIAVIDLGTNTFHLLIAETDGISMQSVYAEKLPVRIGKGGINQGIISEDACERALHAMKAFREKIREFGTEKIYATATSAFRNAKNGLELAEKIRLATGITISIISGEREAELIYYGVREALSLGEERSLIVDIGGGSVEFILANDATIFWKGSFEIGGQRLIELFQKSDPIRQEEITELREYLSQKLEPLDKILTKFPVNTLVGSSGSFDTFSEIDLRKKGFSYSIETKKEYKIPLSDFHHIYQELISKEKASRMQIPGMIELRVDMIVVAGVLIRFILEKYDIKTLRVSTFALKEGVMSRIIKGEPI